MREIVIENELSDLKKTVLVRMILNTLLEEQLSINQITEILEIAQKESRKIPLITVSGNGND